MYACTQENRIGLERKRDLQTHACIALRENEAAYGRWQLSRGKRQETVKVRGAFSSNNDETGSTIPWKSFSAKCLAVKPWPMRISCPAKIGETDELLFM